jgi:hypothetical protein
MGKFDCTLYIYVYVCTHKEWGRRGRLPQVTDKLYHIMLYQVHLPNVGFELTMLEMIGTDCIGS